MAKTPTEIKVELRAMAPAFAKRLAPLFQFLDWKWQPEGQPEHIPTAEEIEKEFYDLIEDLEFQEGEALESVGSGGLEVFYDAPAPESGDPGEYGLRFILEDSRHFGDEEQPAP